MQALESGMSGTIAVGQPATSAVDNIAVLAALGVLAYGASMLTHELLGHGTVCALGGGHTIRLSAWGEACSIQPAGIAAAGPTVQFLGGLTAWGVLRAVPGRFAALRHLLWLVMVFDLLVSSGYLVLSAVTGFGDAAVVIAGLAPVPLWRVLLFVLGAGLYYGSMLLCAAELRRFAGDDVARLKRLTVIPYIAAGIVALAGGALNRTLPPLAGLELAAASAFGGAFGLIRLPDLQQSLRRVTPGPIVLLQPSVVWMAAGALGAVAFVLLLGRGIAG
jgi:Na+-transporting NADH:ubiquinone oxidoreductase subunit NqrD